MEQNTIKETKTRIFDIHCPSCGAPAYYDIKSHVYKCRYCSGKVGVDEAIKANQGFRSIQKQKMHEALGHFELEKGECTGCGAEVIFDKGDAIAHCAFCGRELVRGEFLKLKDIPELIIPFSITKDEARDILSEWCKKNHLKKEARELLKNAGKITGCYLPYELVKGPVYCFVSRVEDGNSYECDGYVDGIFVNCSKNLDNMLLDGMEPYNLDEITGFDFAYIAGHQVKVADITGEELSLRIGGEVSEAYRPLVQKTLETKVVDVDVGTCGVVRMPVLLPAYYISFGKYMAAVNGQTGKVSVRAIRDSHYYIMPWWIRATLSTNIAMGSIMLGMKIFGAENDLVIGAGLALWAFFTVVMLCAYSDKRQKWFRVKRNPRIFTSSGGPYVREAGANGSLKNGKLVQSDTELKKPEILKPVFVMDIDGKETPVIIKFTAFFRMLQMLGLAAVVLFFPVIIALFVNRFNFSQIWFGGSAVWFCITIPLIPVFLVKYGRIELYDHPWIYIIKENGRKKRYKNKKKLNLMLELCILFGIYPKNYYENQWLEKYGRKTVSKKKKKHSGDYKVSAKQKKELAKAILKLFFKPPVCFGVWAGIAIFCGMVYLTAFGIE